MNSLESKSNKTGTLFGDLLIRKRNAAGLTLVELAELTRLSATYLEELELGSADAPNFDVCYKIAQAINSRRQQGFLVQDFWEAAALDRLTRRSRAADQRLTINAISGIAESQAA